MVTLYTGARQAQSSSLPTFLETFGVHQCGAFFFTSLPASAGILFATTFTWWCEVPPTLFAARFSEQGRLKPADP